MKKKNAKNSKQYRLGYPKIIEVIWINGCFCALTLHLSLNYASELLVYRNRKEGIMIYFCSTVAISVYNEYGVYS